LGPPLDPKADALKAGPNIRFWADFVAKVGCNGFGRWAFRWAALWSAGPDAFYATSTLRYATRCAEPEPVAVVRPAMQIASDSGRWRL